MAYRYYGARYDLFTSRHLYRSPANSNIYEHPPYYDGKQLSPWQQKQYNGGYPLYDSNGYASSSVNTNDYVSIEDTKSQVCWKKMVPFRPVTVIHQMKSRGLFPNFPDEYSEKEVNVNTLVLAFDEKHFC